MPSIDINIPQASDTVTSPFNVQGPYSLADSKETEANVEVVVSHLNGQDYPSAAADRPRDTRFLCSALSPA